jgi:hypothetical protein
MALKCNGMNHMTFISQKSPTFVWHFSKDDPCSPYLHPKGFWKHIQRTRKTTAVQGVVAQASYGFNNRWQMWACQVLNRHLYRVIVSTWSTPTSALCREAQYTKIGIKLYDAAW